MPASDQVDISRQLMPVVIDQVAQEQPETSFISLSNEIGYTTITFGQYANAINAVAWWLEHNIGKGHLGEALAYLGIGGGDIYYAILLIAAQKAGYYVSLLSLPAASNLQPANSNSDAIQFATKQSRCSHQPFGFAELSYTHPSGASAIIRGRSLERTSYAYPTTSKS